MRPRNNAPASKVIRGSASAILTGVIRMFSRIVGALVGREMDRRDGSGGMKGAAMGALAVGALRRMGPLGMILGGGYVAKKAYDRRRATRNGPVI